MEKLYLGDCLEVLPTLPDNSVDSIVTDPPAGISFMSKGWDSDKGGRDNWIEWMSNIAKECLRVLKPGGHAFVWALPRTTHWTATAWENGGFEPRDVVAHVFGSGFPKSSNLSKQISKKTGIGLCTCVVPKPMIELEYEKDIKQKNNKTIRNNDRLVVGKSLRGKRTAGNEVETEIQHQIIQADPLVSSKDGVCELQKSHNEKKERVEKVNEPILQSGLCKPVPENERYGNVKIWGRVESDKTESEREGQGLQMLWENGQEQSTSASSNTVQNWRQELNGELSESLSKLPQQDRKYNGEGNRESEDDRKIREWKIDDRFICSECRKLKSDIGGTALKPAREDWWLMRKPIEKGLTIAENVLKWGTSGINIDESRVEYQGDADWKNTFRPSTNVDKNCWIKDKNAVARVDIINRNGRFPANLIHDNSEEVRECFPENRKGFSGGGGPTRFANASGGEKLENYNYHNDSGNASRFFKSIIYQAKASKSERNKGMDDLEAKEWKQENSPNPNRKERPFLPVKNNHPTVKPIALMEYLIKMITPKGGIVLDPFAGSGSTLVAAKENGFGFIGIELTPEYIPIIEARVGIKAETINKRYLADNKILEQEIIYQQEDNEILNKSIDKRRNRCSCGGRIVKTKSGVLTCDSCFNEYVDN